MSCPSPHWDKTASRKCEIGMNDFKKAAINCANYRNFANYGDPAADVIGYENRMLARGCFCSFCRKRPPWRSGTKRNVKTPFAASDRKLRISPLEPNNPLAAFKLAAADYPPLSASR